VTRFKHLVVVGASAGGIETLRTIVGMLPADFPAPICIVVHSAPQAPGVLDRIFARAGVLPVKHPASGEMLQPGHIYVAPPDRHLVIAPGRIRVTRGPRENRFRPAIDPLFRSAAQVYGPRAIGVILSGSLDDGTDGLWTIKQLGGCAIVQDPADALFPDMPRHALDHVNADFVLRAADIAPALVRLTAAPAPEVEPPPVPEQTQVEVKIAMEEDPIEAGLERLGEPSRFACPECHGVLLELKEGARTKFRCHTGHAFSIASLLAAVDEGIEDALWNAIRALEEGNLLVTRMAEHLATTHTVDVRALLDRGDEARQQADVVRKLAMGREPIPSPGTN